MKKFTNLFKKPEPVVEKPVISLTEMKVKYALFSKKCDETIKKYQDLADKKIQQATELKLKGRPANLEIKDYTTYQAKINGIERRKDAFRRQIEKLEENELNKELMRHLGDMVEVMSGAFIDTEEMEKIADNVLKETIRLNEQERKIEEHLAEFDSVMDTVDGVTASELSSVEAGINAMIDQTISDARLSTGNVSAQDVANQVKSKLSINA